MRLRPSSVQHNIVSWRNHDLQRGACSVLCGWLPRCKGYLKFLTIGLVQSSVRPVVQSFMLTAGPDGIRESGPTLLRGQWRPRHRHGFVPAPGLTGSPSHLTALAKWCQTQRGGELATGAEALRLDNRTSQCCSRNHADAWDGGQTLRQLVGAVPSLKLFLQFQSGGRNGAGAGGL